MIQGQRALTQLEVLRDVARRLTADGYDVELDAQPVELASPFGPRRVDLLARRGDEVVVYEIRSRGHIDSAALRELEQLLSALGWRLEVVLVPPEQEAPSVDTVLRRVEEARGLRDDVAALLVAWASLEGALRLLADSVGRPFGSLPGFIRSAYSTDLLSERRFSYISEALILRDRAAHGLEVHVPDGLVEQLLELAVWYVSESFVPLEAMVEWFHGEYKDPADGVPYDSQEGGYQYVAGGPFAADEVMEQRFPDAPPSVVEEAVSLIEEDGLVEWVRQADY